MKAETTRETRYVVDNSLVQEMLKRQMDSVKHRTTSRVENDRLQKILQRQMDYSKYQEEVAAGENSRYTNTLRQKLEEMKAAQRVPRGELSRLDKLIRVHLADIKRQDALPELAAWSDPGATQTILNLLRDLADEAIEMREQARTELDDIEGKLIEEKCDLTDAISRLQRKIDRKKQHLQEIETAISKEELQMKEEKRQFLLKTKPKRAQLERLQRRSKFAAREIR